MWYHDWEWGYSVHTLILLFWQDSVHVRRLERLSDAVVRLESFAGSDKEQNPLFREYHGKDTPPIFCVITTIQRLL